jgi:hypothetical protein
VTDSSGRASRSRVGRDRDRGTGPGWVHADGTRPSGQQGRQAEVGEIHTHREGRGQVVGAWTYAGTSGVTTWRVGGGVWGLGVYHSNGATTTYKPFAHDDKQAHPFRPTHPAPHKPIRACQVPHRGPPTAHASRTKASAHTRLRPRYRGTWARCKPRPCTRRYRGCGIGRGVVELHLVKQLIRKAVVLGRTLQIQGSDGQGSG